MAARWKVPVFPVWRSAGLRRERAPRNTSPVPCREAAGGRAKVRRGSRSHPGWARGPAILRRSASAQWLRRRCRTRRNFPGYFQMPRGRAPTWGGRPPWRDAVCRQSASASSCAGRARLPARRAGWRFRAARSHPRRGCCPPRQRPGRGRRSRQNRGGRPSRCQTAPSFPAAAWPTAASPRRARAWPPATPPLRRFRAW